MVGSTLTAGNGTTSYTDYLEKKNDMTVDVVAKKDATLTGDGENSYMALLQGMDADASYDMIMVETDRGRSESGSGRIGQRRSIGRL